MFNVLIVGLLEGDLKTIGLNLAERLDFFYLNSEDMISYSLYDKVEMGKVCGLKYQKEEERKVIFGLNSFERTVISMSYETFSNNIDSISSSNCIFYLRQTQNVFNKRLEEIKKNCINDEKINKYEISQLVFKQRDNYLKKNCNFVIKYDITKLVKLIDEIEYKIMEQK